MIKITVSPTPLERALFFIVIDTFLSFISLYLSYGLRFSFNTEPILVETMPVVFLVLLVLKISAIAYMKLYLVAWRFFSLNDAKHLLYAHFVAYGLFLVIFFIYSDPFMPMPRSIVLIDFFLSLSFLGSFRIIKRAILESSNTSTNNTVIIGANPKAASLIKSFLDKEVDYLPVAIVDSDKKSIGTYISNVKVYDIKDLDRVVKALSITSAVIAKELSPKELDECFEMLRNSGIKKIKIAKILDDRKSDLEELTIEDLLARKPKDLDMEVIRNFIKNKVVAITGGGGSIGSEIALQCAKMGARKLILIDNSEYNLYAIGEKLADRNVRLVLGSVCDEALMKGVLGSENIDILIHAAAYKHVPLVEENVEEAIKNNILCTKITIDAAIEFKVKKIVLISTDKAVRPTSVMGATKRVCELYAQNVDSKSSEIVAVRFGNVLGSSGSVIPKFKEQIAKGGPLTVTHKDIKRYFMMIPEACALVLQASAIAKGGELFILDMGEPVKIVDLAKKMLKLSNREDIEIIFTGLRAGEKLYEELFLDESEKKTEYESIYVGKKSFYDINQLNADIITLLNAQDKLSVLKKIVPEFDHYRGEL